LALEAPLDDIKEENDKNGLSKEQEDTATQPDLL